MDTSLNKKQVQVLAFLQETLGENMIPFVAIGGLAAIAWGARRPLADIDIQVGKSNLLTVEKLLSKYVTTNVQHYVTENWDIQQMILSIDGVGVDVCGAEEFYVIKDGKRYLVENSVNDAIVKDIHGIPIPIMPKDRLIAYKEYIGRPVDLDDLDQLLS